MTLKTHLAAVLNRMRRPEPISGCDLVDLGLSSWEYDTLARSRPSMPEQMKRMAAKFGLREADLERDRWTHLDLSLACAQCDRAGDCAAYLRGEGVFERTECPNAERFAELATA